MADRTYFVICEDKCLFEAMTKEQIYDAIAEATGSTPTGVDSAFITKIKEQNANRELKFWVGTQAQYNAIAEPAIDTFYLITDPTFESDIQVEIAELQTEINALKELKPIDISSSIELSTNNTNVTVVSKKYVYDPANGIVHYWVILAVTEDTSTSIKISHAGNSYRPSTKTTAVTAIDYDRAEKATYNAISGVNPYIFISLNQSKSESITAGNVYITGFYFCEGE